MLASPTYNGGLYPIMENLLNDMKALNVQKRTVAFLENGTWAPTSVKQMQAKIEELKDMEILGSPVTVKSALKKSQEENLDALCGEIVDSMR